MIFSSAGSFTGESIRKRNSVIALFVVIALCLIYIFVSILPLFSSASHVTTRSPLVSVWMTTPDQTNLLARQSNQPTFSLAQIGFQKANNTISVDTTQTYQPIDGFGASFTDASAWLVFSRMSTDQRKVLMNNLFGLSGNGIGLSFLRQPIGASDMTLPQGFTEPPYSQASPAPGDYSYQETPDAPFSIQHDQAYIIPVLKQAFAINPELKIIGVPWSAPGWMKSQIGLRHSMDGGAFSTDEEANYAHYLTLYVQDYYAQGLPIYAITPQNEPEASKSSMPSMLMDANTEISFINNDLGPALQDIDQTLSLTYHKQVHVRIFAYDHNRDDMKYPAQVLARAATYTDGLAFHCYQPQDGPELQAGLYQTILRLNAAGSAQSASYVKKGIYETECSDFIYDSATGRPRTWQQEFQDTMQLALGEINNDSQSVLRWAIALEQNGQPNLETTDACTTCLGIVSIDPNTGNVTYTGDYYGLGQFSKFVQPGYLRVSVSNSSSDLQDAAFESPDHNSVVLVAYNGTQSSKTAIIQWQGESFSYTVPAGAAATFIWSAGNASSHSPASPTASIYSRAWQSQNLFMVPLEIVRRRTMKTGI